MNSVKKLCSLRPCRPLDESGFTLFEILAATMILATTLVILLQLFSGGLRAGYAADQYSRAVLHAREKMDELLLQKAMRTETLSGGWEDGFTWQADIEPWSLEPEEEENTRKDLTTFRVSLAVSWREGVRERKLVVESLSLAEAKRGDAS